MVEVVVHHQQFLDLILHELVVELEDLILPVPEHPLLRVELAEVDPLVVQEQPILAEAVVAEAISENNPVVLVALVSSS